MSSTSGKPATREAILDATDRLLAKRGFRKMTMAHIAVEAGVSRRAVYTYFETKAEVGLSSIDRVIEQTHERLRTIAGGHGDPRQRLRRMLIERVLLRIDSVHAYRQSLDELFELVRPAYMARRRRHFAVEEQLLRRVLDAGRHSGVFVFTGSATTAQTLVRATNAFLPYNLSGMELGQRAQLAQAVAHMATLLLRGLTRKHQ